MGGATGASRAIGVGWAPRSICIVWTHRDTGPTRTASVRWKWNNEWAARSAPKPATSSHPPRPDLGWRRRRCTGAWGTACTGSWTWPLGWTKSACTRAPPPPPVPAATPGALLALRQNTTVKTGVAIRRRKGDRNPAYSETRLALTQQAAVKRRPSRCRCSETEDGALRGRPNPSRSSHSSGTVQGKGPTQQAVCQSMTRHDLCLLTARWPSPLKQHAVSVDVTVQIVENQFLLPFSYPPRTHDVPTTCPPRAHHVPAMYPRRARHVPATYPRRAHHVPATCPRRTRHVPTTYPPRARIPVSRPGTARGQPLSNHPCAGEAQIASGLATSDGMQQ